MSWKLVDRVVVDNSGANVTGLVPARMSTATLALVLAAPAMLAALEGMNHVTEGGFCICPCADGMKHRDFHSTACNDAWDAIKTARTVVDEESQAGPIVHEATTEEDGITCDACRETIRKGQTIVEFGDESITHEDCSAPENVPVKVREYRDDSQGYDYVTTIAGRGCTPRKGIGAGICVNVAAIDADGVADIWTESPITGPYTDRVEFRTLKVREVSR